MKTKSLLTLTVLYFFAFAQACGGAQQPAPLPSASPPSTLLPPATSPIKAPPTETSIPTPLPAPKSPCDNALYPLLPGNTWVYQTTGQVRMTFQVTGVEGNLASIHVIDEENGITTDDTVLCEEGAIVNLPLVYLSLLLSDFLDGVLNTFQNSGITAPSLQVFLDNQWLYSWEVKKLVEQPVKVSPPGSDLSGIILRSNVITIESNTQGIREPVNTPAGSYPQALLVNSELISPVTVTNVGGVFKVQYKEWFEPYVGLLKIEAVSASIDYAGFPIPLPMEKSLELVEFNINK